MRKYLKIFFITLISFLLFSLSKSVSANSINEIAMDIYVDSSGNAAVTEVWNCSANQGTEFYHPYYNLGTSKITNLTVSEGSNTYETLSYWNTSGSLSSKAYKCGINTISNGVELCWGISEYGSHTYTVKYNISNFVSELSDSQMIYWTLIPYNFSNKIGKAYIQIHTDFDIPDTTGVWGYGNYGGYAYVYDGYIVMESNGSLASNEYMTILVQFPLGSFNASNKLNHNFDYYLDMANEGATKSEEQDWDGIFVIYIIFASLVFIWLVVVIIRALFFPNNSYDYGKDGKKIVNNPVYFRDIPLKDDIFKAFFISDLYKICNNKTNFFGCCILRWLQASYIKIEKRDEGSVIKKEKTFIIFEENVSEKISNDSERKLYNMLYRASDDGVLGEKQFKSWANKNYDEFFRCFDDILDDEKYALIDQHLLTKVVRKVLKIFKVTQYTISPEIKQDAVKLAGLKKYLKDYTLIKDREAIEVKLFEEYLIYAQMFGIAKQVAKEFKDLYPDIVNDSNFGSYDNIIFINTYSAFAYNQANTSRARAESYSSGGGGFSSGGGGGGSFGGGGGRRRFPLKFKILLDKRIKNVI